MISEQEAREAAAKVNELSAKLTDVDFEDAEAAVSHKGMETACDVLSQWALQELARREAERADKAKSISDALNVIANFASSMIRGDELPVVDGDSPIPSKESLVRLHRKQYEQGEQLKAAVESIQAALKGREE